MGTYILGDVEGAMGYNVKPPVPILFMCANSGQFMPFMIRDTFSVRGAL